MAPSDDAFRRSGSAGEGSLWPLYRGTRAVTSTGAGRPGGWPRELADMVRACNGADPCGRGHQRALSVTCSCTAPDVSTEQSSRGEECQTSTRDQGEQPDGRVHRRTRCRKRQRAADAPRFNGSVLPAYVERSRYVCPAEPYRPSRLLMRHSGGLLYVPKDL